MSSSLSTRLTDRDLSDVSRSDPQLSPLCGCCSTRHSLTVSQPHSKLHVLLPFLAAASASVTFSDSSIFVTTSDQFTFFMSDCQLAMASLNSSRSIVPEPSESAALKTSSTSSESTYEGDK